MLDIYEYCSWGVCSSQVTLFLHQLTKLQIEHHLI